MIPRKEKFIGLSSSGCSIRAPRESRNKSFDQLDINFPPPSLSGEKLVGEESDSPLESLEIE